MQEKATITNNLNDFQFNSIIGTGGIGSGIVFSLEGNHNLGREESRLGKLQPYKDYCKQHIILHYLSVLLTSKNKNFKVFPIGKVGNDDIGKELQKMMKKAGMNVDSVSVSSTNRTLFSVCFQYPDGSGGNITTSNGASSEVSIKNIEAFFNKNSFEKSNKSIVLAAPEVPLDTRLELLKMGRAKGFTNVASILSSEVTEFEKKGGFELTDILSINMDEAKSVSKLEGILLSYQIVESAFNWIKEYNNNITLLVTDGSKGSYCCNDNLIKFTPIVAVDNVSSTAGAGDAFLSGFLNGICCGLPIFKVDDNQYFAETPLETAVEMGTILAAISVGCPDTIDLSINANRLKSFCLQKEFKMSENFWNVFSENN